MADLYLSDTDESAVDQVLAEAMDHCVLEQVAAINCSSFTSDSSLPPHLETRFHRLKTFPSSSAPKQPHEREWSTQGGKANSPAEKDKDGNFSSGYASFPSHFSHFDDKNGNFNVKDGNEGKLSSGYVENGKEKINSGVRKGKEGKLSSGYVSNCSNSSKSDVKMSKDRKFPSGYVSNSSRSSEGDEDFPKSKAKLVDRKRKQGKFASGYVSKPTNDSSSGDENFGKVKAKSVDRKRKEKKFGSGYVSNSASDSSSGDEGSAKVKVKSVDRKRKEGKCPSRSGSFRSDSSSSETETVAKTGCFWCSPKRVSRKKSGKKNVGGELGVVWGKHEDILSDLRSFSAKEQKKLMKRAMQEEEKINKEAEKIVKWAKHTSARFEFSGIDDELSD